MKVVLLPNLVGFPAVSMERYANELFEQLPRIAPSGWSFDRIVCGAEERLVSLIPGSQGEKWASRAGRFVKYPRIAAQTVADVYHVLDHSHANLANAVPGEKTVITCHDIIPYLAAIGKIPMASGRLTKYTFPQRVRSMRRCRYILTDSDSTKQDLHHYFQVPLEQMQTVYLGLNPQFTRFPEGGEAVQESQTQAIRAKHGIPPEAKIIFHIAGTLRYKNTPTLLKAVRELRELHTSGNDLWLLRAGGAFFPDEEDLIAELGIRERVVHAGRIPDDAGLAAYYRASDVLAFPSLYEGFGWPPLEAMACGTPVVTSNAASLPEVVGDAGLTVPPTDVSALAHALYTALTDEALRRTLRAKGMAQSALFTWENCAKNTLAVYRRIGENTV